MKIEGQIMLTQSGYDEKHNTDFLSRMTSLSFNTIA